MEFFSKNQISCHPCNREMTHVMGELSFEEEGLRIKVGNVPLLRCDQCGDEFVPGPIAEEISKIINELATELREAPLSCTDVSTTFVDRSLSSEVTALRA